MSSPPRDPAAPRAGLLLAGALAAIAFAYAGALGGGFVWDDPALIERHPAVVELRPLGDYFGRLFWSNPELDQSPAYYRPLTTLSYAIEWRLWGPQPLFFHLTNLALHLGVCALVFGLTRRAGAGPLAATAAALGFGLFPRATESVAWISGRTDVLAALGALGGWLLHRSEPERPGRRVAAAAAVALGLLCKEVAIAGAAAIAALEAARWRDGRSDARRALANLAPLGVALALYAAARLWASYASDVPAPPDLTLSGVDHTRLVLQALGSYLAMLADPLRPQLLVGVPQVADPLRVALGAAGALALAAGAALLVRRGRPAQAAAGALALCALLPVLWIVPLPLHSVAADRLLYLTVAGLAVLLASALPAPGPRAARGALAAAALAALAFGAATVRRSEVWADELLLWREAVSEAPAESVLAPAALGEALLRRGRCEEALPWLEEAAARHARLPRSLPGGGAPDFVAGNAALCLAQLGRFDEAEARLATLVRERPRSPLHRANLALLHGQRLDFAAAERELEAALTLYPGYPRALELRAALAQAEAEWQGLPAERPDEPFEVRAARARVYARVKNDWRARALFSEVLADADAGGDTLQRAAVYLVLRGTPDAARRAVECLKKRPDLREQALALEKALDARLLQESGAG